MKVEWWKVEWWKGGSVERWKTGKVAKLASGGITTVVTSVAAKGKTEMKAWLSTDDSDRRG